MTKKSWWIKRFFEPLKWKATFMIYPFIVSTINAIFSIVVVEIFKRTTSYIQNWDYSGVKIALLIYVWVFILQSAFKWIFRNYGRTTMTYEWEQYIQNLWLRKFFKLDNVSVEKLWTWKMQHIISNWIKTRKKLYYNLTQQIPPILVTWLFIIWQIQEAVGLIYTALFVVLFIIHLFFVKHFTNCNFTPRKQWAEMESEHNRHLVKIIMAKMEIVQNNKEITEIQQSNKILNWILPITKKVSFYLNAIGQTSRTFTRLLNMFIIMYWLYLIKNWWDLSTFVWLVVCSTLFSKEIDKFTNFYKEFTNDFTQVEKMRDEFDKIPDMKNHFSNIPFKYKKWDIEIKNISFGYGNSKDIFDNFSLAIEWWKKTALVWESWWWKSTLIKLLAWYLCPDKWTIYVDGQNISEVDIHSYYKNIWYLTQDPSVFDWTIYDNLLYALKEKPSDAKLKKIIKEAKCEFIYDFTNWLQTEIWERWIRLSWWQKQRLAIAKIMMKNPNIILLDEPTSALDSFNEELISQALDNLFKGKTVIIAAHRLQTVKSADKILLFENGKIVEQWSHNSLIRKNWKYKRMLDLQSGF